MHPLQGRYVSQGIPVNSDQIGLIVSEVRRVTESRGRTFVATAGMTPQNRELARYVGLLSDDNRVDLRKLTQMLLSRKVFIHETLVSVRNDPHKNMVGYFARAIRSYISTFKWTNAQNRTVKKVKKKVRSGELPNPKELLDHLPEHS